MDDWALPEINLSLCDRCGTCVEQCPTGAVEMGSEGPFIARPAERVLTRLSGERTLQRIEKETERERNGYGKYTE